MPSPRPLTAAAFLAAVAAAYSLLPVASGLNVEISPADVVYAAIFGAALGAALGVVVRRWRERPDLAWALIAAVWALLEAGYTVGVVIKPTRWPPLVYSAPAMAAPALIAAAISLRALVAARRGDATRVPPAVAIVASWTAVAALWMWIPRWLRPLVDAPDARWLLWGAFDLAWIAASAGAVVLAAVALLGGRGRLAIAAVVLAGLQFLPHAVSEVRAPLPATEQPSIVWIMIDSLRVDHASAYGYARPTTPNLEALAAAGTLVRSHVSSGARTESTYGKMLTLDAAGDGYEVAQPIPLSGARGLLPRGWFPPQAGLLVAMRDAGYRTALFHVYHDLLEDRGLQPWLQEFDDVMRTRLSGDAAMGPYVLRMLLGDALDGIPRMDRFARHRRRFLADVVVARVSRFLDQRDDRQPLFLIVHLAGGHYPYYRFADEPRLMEPRPAGIAGDYDDALRAADAQLGALADAIIKRLPHPVMFVFADHGATLAGEPHLPQHVNVPLVVTPPLPAAPTMTTSSVDITATTVAMARGGPPRCGPTLARDLRCPAVPGEVRVVDHTGHGRFILAAQLPDAMVAADIKDGSVVVGADRGEPPSPCDFFARSRSASLRLAVSPLEQRDGLAPRLRAQLARCNLSARP